MALTTFVIVVAVVVAGIGLLADLIWLVFVAAAVALAAGVEGLREATGARRTPHNHPG